jgi:hypothetical protein
MRLIRYSFAIACFDGLFEASASLQTKHNNPNVVALVKA